jgi:hypothetical protein
MGGFTKSLHSQYLSVHNLAHMCQLERMSQSNGVVQQRALRVQKSSGENKNCYVQTLVLAWLSYLGEASVDVENVHTSFPVVHDCLRLILERLHCSTKRSV